MMDITLDRVAPAVLRATSKSIDILTYFDSLPWVHSDEAAPWTAWRAFIAGLFGLPMSQKEGKIWDRCTGGRKPGREQYSEAYAICGRRARKSAIAAVIGTYLGTHRDYRKYLAPGERARGLVMSKDKDDAGQIYNFTKAILEDKMLRHLLERDPSSEELHLSNQVEFKIRAISLTGGRSRAIFFSGLDEFAFWPMKESATPAEDVVKGIKPAMSNIPHSLLLGLSTRYAKRGMLYDIYEEHFGKNSDILVWSADSLTMHDSPTMRVFIADEMEKDPIGAATEYGDEWRADVRSFLTPEAVRAVMVTGRREVPAPQKRPEDPKDNYFCFVDTSGGASDAYTMAVAHWDHGSRRAILDCLRGFEPDPQTGVFSTSTATQEHAQTVKRYGVGFVTGDHYAGNWPRERWKDNSLQYEVSKRDKAKIYRDALPLITAQECELLDHPVLKHQLQTLERRISPTGKPIITHPPNGHDDYANAACGALTLAYEYGKNLPQQKGEKRYADTFAVQEEREREAIEEVTRRAPTYDHPFTTLWNQD